jgi:hypothetical protein
MVFRLDETAEFDALLAAIDAADTRNGADLHQLRSK